MESMFRSLSIGRWPKEQIVAGEPWVQTLSGIKSSCKKILSAQFQVQELAKLFWPRLKLKTSLQRFFVNVFYTLNHGIIAALYRKRLIKNLHQNFTCLKPAKKTYLIGPLRENSSYSSFDFPEAKQVKWHFAYGGNLSNFPL